MRNKKKQTNNLVDRSNLSKKVKYLVLEIVDYNVDSGTGSSNLLKGNPWQLL